MALVRLFESPEETFDDYKKIIKILLFAGASRDELDGNGYTPLALLEENYESLSKQ